MFRLGKQLKFLLKYHVIWLFKPSKTIKKYMTDEFEKYDIRQVEYTKAGNMEIEITVNK